MFDGAANIREQASKLSELLTHAQSERYTGDLKLAHIEAISVVLDELAREVAMMDDVCRAVLDLAHDIARRSKRKAGEGE